MTEAINDAPFKPFPIFTEYINLRHVKYTAYYLAIAGVIACAVMVVAILCGSEATQLGNTYCMLLFRVLRSEYFVF